jgi:peptidoglycan hydrolase CwlO-like protein
MQTAPTRTPTAGPSTSRPSPSRPSPWVAARALAIVAVAVLLLGTRLTAPSVGDLQGQISAASSAAASLRDQVAADSREIASTTGGLQSARNRLAGIQSQLDGRVAQLRTVQTSLLTARDRLVDLENRLHLATTALAANLVAGYEGQQPDVMTVVLESHGFGDLLNQMSDMARIAHQDTRVVGLTRTARAQVSSQATALESLEARDRKLANQILTQRNQAAALESALLHEQIRQLDARSRTSAHYTNVSARLKTLQKTAAEQAARAAEAATRAAATGNAAVGGLNVNTGGMVQPPAGAPAAVGEIMAAGNAIATLPYIYGGGHASFHADGYDCSGSVSYALAAAGLVSSPMVSGDFENWGDPGPGRWVTIYANAGHVWMEVAGWRFDTVALAEIGTRWARGGGEFSGFVVRHPPGL